MKKIFVLLFILIGCNIFAWESIETVDDFNEPTGEIRIIQYDTKGKSLVFIDKVDKGYSISFYCDEFIGGRGEYSKSTLKIKIDQEKPITLNGYVWPDNITVSTIPPNNLIEKMKKGKVMKVVIEKYDSQTFLLQFNLGDFEENLKKVKK